MALDPYAFAAGYYALFWARPDALPPIEFFTDLAPPGGQALEIGPGTGRITIPVAERVAGVHCLERSSTMRSVLLARIVDRPDLRERITVLDGAAPDFDLGRRFDYVYLAGVLEHVPPDVRPKLFATLAAHLADDGVLAMDMVTDQPVPDEPEHPVERAGVGECRYQLSVAFQPLGEDLARLRYVYRTWYRDRLIATESVERDHHLHRPDAVRRDLAAAGLTVTGGSVWDRPAGDPADPGTLIATHRARP